jgi:Ala-tRNA(Pro) deacylase
MIAREPGGKLGREASGLDYVLRPRLAMFWQLARETQTMTIAATVKSYIEGRGVAYEVIAHPASGSSHETAEAAHVDEGHIAKGVILKDSAGAVMVVVPGNTWVDLSAIGKELDREMVIAVEKDAAGYFPDCDPGAIPPLGPAYGMETLVDKALTSLAYVYLESGDHRSLVKISGEALPQLLSGVRHGHFCEDD